eukprot:TRINITY_DN12548_c0_g1_i1.p1 TRINITY_DN12548_c0_g1~~TRINITY_DN12548_c0_g1_i1.p1  ORF type:complete len:237 (-),score=36.97 TRINITY_DN12548_c0_g1_i1:18-728(-)
MKFHTDYNDYVSYFTILSLTIGYLAFTYIFKKFMDNRGTPFSVGKFPILYNAVQVSFSAYLAVGIFVNLVKFPNVIGLNHEFTPELEWYVFLHYLSKILDFVDTVIIVAKMDYRRLSFLHLFHHSTILGVWGFLLHYGIGNGTGAFGAMMNSLVHSIMYSHYLLSSLKINNPYKMWITRVQMIQFAICETHAIVCSFLETTPVRKVAIVQVVYQILMLYLFNDFQKKTYKKKIVKE